MKRIKHDWLPFSYAEQDNDWAPEPGLFFFDVKPTPEACKLMGVRRGTHFAAAEFLFDSGCLSFGRLHTTEIHTTDCHEFDSEFCPSHTLRFKPVWELHMS